MSKLKGTLRALCLLTIGLSSLAYSLPVRFGSPDMDGATCVDVDPVSGSVYVAGSYYTNKLVKSQMCLNKYTAAGVLVWSRLYGNKGEDTALDVKVSPTTGEIYVTGRVENALTGHTDCATLKYSPGGVRLSSHLYGGALDDAGKKITLDGVGNCLVAGYASQSASGKDIMLLKYSPGLTLTLPVVLTSASGDDEANAIAVNSNGAYLACKMTNSAGNQDGFLARISLVSGAVLGNRLFAGTASANDQLVDVAYDAAGSVYVAGTVDDTVGGQMIVAGKFNPNLAVTNWVSPFNAVAGTTDDFANRLKVTSTDVYVAGASFGVTGLGADAVMVSFDPLTGGLRPGWPWFYHYLDHDEVKDFVVDPVSGSIFAGLYTDGFPSHDYATIRINGGLTSWVNRYHYYSHDEMSEVALSLTGNPIITGRSEGPGTSFDWATGMCDATTGSDVW
ncbi:MAG: hypothetical protein JNM34_00230 [Chthonomonadaceae bacterium]|nr:hypothetical protein [Chthonomonadaceae bacterium]